MVAILESTVNGDLFTCGGSLIDSRVVLTAAHCVQNREDEECGEDASFSALLRKIQVPIVDFATCQTMMQGNKLGSRFRLDPSFLCAGNVNRFSYKTVLNKCPYPSLLLTPVPGPPQTMLQVGIVSCGLGCGAVPGVIANLGKFNQWVTNVVIRETLQL